jgi:hypothetical protein
MATRPRLNRAHAIREFCLECMGGQRQQINECNDRACALWEWRKGDGGPEWTMTLLRRQIQTRGCNSPSDACEREIGAKTGAHRPISDN